MCMSKKSKVDWKLILIEKSFTAKLTYMCVQMNVNLPLKGKMPKSKDKSQNEKKVPVTISICFD